MEIRLTDNNIQIVIHTSEIKFTDNIYNYKSVSYSSHTFKQLKSLPNN